MVFVLAKMNIYYFDSKIMQKKNYNVIFFSIFFIFFSLMVNFFYF
jgi:hypothetical protein